MFATAGRPLILRALSLGAALTIAVVVIFPGSGMRTADLVALMRESLSARLALWSCWCLLATPAIAPAFDAQGTRVLRSLRPKQQLVAALFPLLGIVEFPWAILFALGDGAVAAAGATATAIALQASLVARRLDLFSLSSLLVVVGTSAWVLAPAATLAFASVDAAWGSALDRSEQPLTLLHRTHPLPALVVAHLLRVVRAAKMRLGIGAMSTLTGALGTALSLRNDHAARPGHRALAILALPLCICAAALVRPVLESERSCGPTLRSTSTAPAFVITAFLLAIAIPTSAYGATAGGIASPPLAWLTSSWAFGIAIAVAVWGRVHSRTSRKDPAVFVVGVLALAAFAVVVAV
jgi:hypothetical protein